MYWVAKVSRLTVIDGNPAGGKQVQHLPAWVPTMWAQVNQMIMLEQLLAHPLVVQKRLLPGFTFPTPYSTGPWVARLWLPCLTSFVFSFAYFLANRASSVSPISL